MFRFSTIVAAAGLMVLAGCGTPQFSNTGRELMRPLQTAVTAKNQEWIDATEEKIKAQRQSGGLSEAEFESLTQIIQKSRKGNWEEAEQMLFALMEGQRASVEDQERLEAATPKPPADNRQKTAAKRRP